MYGYLTYHGSLYLILSNWVIDEGRSTILNNKKSLEEIISRLEKENNGPDHNSFLEPNMSLVMDIKEYRREQFNRYNYVVEG